MIIEENCLSKRHGLAMLSELNTYFDVKIATPLSIESIEKVFGVDIYGELLFGAIE